MKLLCLIGLHRRLGRSVKASEEGYRGACRDCGVALVKPYGGRWRKARPKTNHRG